VHTFEVLRTEQLTPHITRVVLGGGGFDTFKPNDFTDSYVKIVFVRNDIDAAALPQPLTLDSFNELPVEQRPTVRTYTVRSADTEKRELVIDAAQGRFGGAPSQRRFDLHLVGPDDTPLRPSRGVAVHYHGAAVRQRLG
jgi:hypothetical protein